MIRYNDISRDQFVPEDQFIPDVKMEDEEESYYQIYGNGNKFNPMNEVNYNNSINNNNNNNNNNFKVPPISTFCGPSMNSQFYNRNNLIRSSYMSAETETTSGMRSNYIVSSDGESSPKSIDETDSTPVYCVRGVRTITRNPGRITRQRGTGISKCRGRGKKAEYTAPKEKDRARLFNEAFDCLRKRIPSIPASKKLSKIEILRLAICYMSYLKFLLETDTPKNYDTPTTCVSTPSPSTPESNSLETSSPTNSTEEEETLVPS